MILLKKVLIVLFILILLIGGVTTGSLYVYHANAARPLSSAVDPLEVNVADNESLYLVVDRLTSDGILRNSWLTKLYYRLSGLDLEIEPGRHEVPASASLKEMLNALQSENLDNVRVSIPEGLTISNIADRLEKAGLVERTAFLDAIAAYPAPDYVPDLGERRYRLEGYLRPDTYTFTKGTPPEAIIAKMIEEFERSLRTILKDTGHELPESAWDEVLIKASMIERETNNADERALVASVIENRLAINMKLQLDATILYALGVDSKAVTYADMAFASPFNTYHVKGLPAGPISSPSSAAIRAVLDPADTDFIYYILNPTTGKHFFTPDYDEFLAKKREYNSGGPILTIPEQTQSTQPVTTQPENPYEGPSGVPFEVLPPGTTQPAVTAP